MDCQCEQKIKIFRGDDTNWNGENLLNFVVTSASPEIDLSTMTAKFIVGSIVFDNISLETGEFTINFTHQQTATMPWGLNKGVLQILDADKRIKTVTNSINLFVTSEPFEEESQTIDVTVPEGSPVTIELTVGSGGQGGGSWGSITGNIQDQEDLQAEFDTKMDKSGGTFTGDVTLAQWVSLKTQVGELHDINDNIVLGGKGTNYGLYVAPDGTSAALVGNNSLKDIITTEDVKSTYSASGTDPVNGVAVASALSPINAVIPNQATAENQLADKNFVNSSVATNTANFIGTFNSVADLEEYSGTLTNNDYAFVISTDSAGNTVYNRYKYTTATSPASWQFEYALNNSSFTSNQWAAINSGATSTNIAQIATNTTAIAGKQDTISDLETIRSGAALGATAVQPSTLANYATTTDLAAKQDKTLTIPITVDGTQETTVEGALGAINTLAGKGLRNKCRDTANSLFVSPNQTDEIGTAGSTLNSVYFGPQAQTTLGTGTTVVGSNGVTQYNYGTSVGSGAKANQGYCTAIGSKAKASGGRNAQYGGSTALGADANANGGTALGAGTNASSTSVAVGRGYDSTNVVTASGNRSIAIGALSGTSIQCKATGVDSIQLGKGVNSTAQLFQVYSYPLLDGNTGKIPAERLPSISSAPTLTWYTGNTGTTVTIADTSSANLVKIYKNGVLLEPTADYSISGTTLTLVTALVSTDKITTEVF